MSIEGLGKKFQEARLARGLTLDEAARMTKIRPSRLAEIEADDFSQFPSLAYAKGFLLIYGKFLDVDVTEYLEAFETSDYVTVDGYSYLQDNPPPKPARTPIVRQSTNRAPLVPLLIAVVVLLIGFFFMKLILNLQRITPRNAPMVGVPQASVSPPSVTPGAIIAQQSPTPAARNVPGPPASVAPPSATLAPAAAVRPAPASAATAPAVASNSPLASPSPAKEPEVRRAEPVGAEDLVKGATASGTAPPAESTGANRVDIKPLKKTYIKVVVDNEALKPAFERWISPADGTVQFRGQHIAVRVLDRDAVQIKKNGKLIADGDTDVTVE
jgi:cytoskeletal protein RodZ